MHFRAQRKLQGEVSLSDSLEGDGDGGSLSLMDVLSVDDDMLEELDNRDTCIQMRRCVERCLTDRERDIVVRRYGLDGRPPMTQREIAAERGISRSYVSQRRYSSVSSTRSIRETNISRFVGAVARKRSTSSLARAFCLSGEKSGRSIWERRCSSAARSALTFR